MNDEAFKAKLEERALAANNKNGVDESTEKSETSDIESLKRRITISSLTPLINAFALILLLIAFIGTFCIGPDCDRNRIRFMQILFTVASFAISGISFFYSTKTLSLAKKYNKSLGFCKVLIYLGYLLGFAALGISSCYIVSLAL